MRKICCAIVVSCLFCLPNVVSAMLTPTGTYGIKFQRGAWSAEDTSVPVVIFAKSMARPHPFASFDNYQDLSGQDLNVKIYLEYVGNVHNPNVFEWTWYVNAQELVQNPTFGKFLDGNGTDPLTITITGLDFAEAPKVAFEPQTTHVYYYDCDYHPQWIPGYDRNFSPTTLGAYGYYQRTGVRPFSTSEPVAYPSQPYTALERASTPAYGTANQISSSTNSLTFELPDMYVPHGSDPNGVAFRPTYEVSFGGGFYVVPEPMTLAMMVLGLSQVLRRRK